jgi:hypothetical protein
MIFLATVLSLTLPAYNVLIPPRLQPPTCAASVIPLTDLSRLEVWGAPQYEPVRMIMDLDVRGREGQAIQVVFDDEAKVWTVWCVTRDFSGNTSCESNHIGVNLGPGIPDPSHPARP